MGGVSGFAVDVQNVGGVFSVLIVASAAPAGSVPPVGSLFYYYYLSQKAQHLVVNVSAKKQDYFTFSWRNVHIYPLIGGKKWPGKVVFS